MDISNRIIWVDWAKVLGIMIVIFCHVPQYQTLEKTFLCYLQMPLFFFLSGYLHKVPHTLKESIYKYWKSIIIPYILFQFIFYPYWLVRYKFEGGNVSDLFQSLFKPFLQCMWGIPIDGITWFLIALLIMKLYTDLISKSIYKNVYIGISVFTSVIVSYIIWSDSVVNISFAIDSLFSFFPFFILGFYCKSIYYPLINLNQVQNIKKHAILTISLFLFTILCILFIPTNNYFLSRILFYLLGTTGTFCIIEICLFIKYIPYFIVIISNGTIILLGLHWMFIGGINFFLENMFLNVEDIKYNTFEACVIVLFITTINYFIIKFCNKHFKALLGYR